MIYSTRLTMPAFVVGDRSTPLRDFVRLLNTVDEHHNLEAKRGSGIGKSVLETVCAFSNEPRLGGGVILLGVEPEEGSLFPAYIVSGVADPDQLTANLVSQCHDTFNVPVRVVTQTEQVNGKTVLGIHVLEAPAASKPVYFRKSGLPNGAYRRVGSSDVRCTEEDLTVLFGDRNVEQFDATVVAGTTLADIDLDALAAYRRARNTVNASAEELQYSDEEMLVALRCAERTNSGHTLTVAGLVLFGRPLSLRRFTPMVRVDYVRVPGREWVPDSAQRFEATLDMRGPIMTLLGRAQAAIQDDLPRAFNLPEGALQRADEPRLPLRVIREALVNAVMHRSYRDQQPVLIIRYANRLEIQNPGFSLKAEERLGEPGSVPRNPAIAAVLHDIHFAETKGTGVRTMRVEMERAGLSTPQFVSDRVGNRFTATFLFHHFLDEEDVRWLGQFRDLDLSDEDRKALVFVREAGRIDNSVYRDLNKVDPLAAGQALRRLRDLDLLSAQGRTSGTFYVPGSRFLKGSVMPNNMQDSYATAMQDNDAGMQDRPPSLQVKPPATMQDKTAATVEATAQASGEGSAAVPPKSSLVQREEIPQTIEGKLKSLGRRADPERVRAAVLDLTTWRPLRVQDIAGLLNRSVTYTREVVRQMVAEGLLEYTQPQSPQHPDQAYRPTRK